jgi:pimeloyl-ACP methyl ester carboxylesterase
VAGGPVWPPPDRGLPPLRHLGRLDSQPPVWLESRAALEGLRLRRAAVFRGDGLPAGDGRPVLLVPGFMAGDRSLATLHGWLTRLGYDAHPAGITFNIRYSEAVLRTLLIRVGDLYGWSGCRVTIVGHSRGGLLAAVAAARHPELVERVVALGSPLADPFDVHPITMAGVRAAQVVNLLGFWRTGSVERSFLGDLAVRARVPLTSVYTRSDGIVHWRACLRPDAECVEVGGSHVGLAVNPEVYALLAGVLARPLRARWTGRERTGA